MKLDTLKKRLDKNRPMTEITLRMPEDVLDDLERLAPKLGFSGHLPLIKAYVGQSLRLDLERFEDDKVSAWVAKLKQRGISESVLDEVLSEVELIGH